MTTCAGSLYATCCSCYTSSNVANSLFPRYRRCSPQFPLSLSFSSISSSPSRSIVAKALSSGDKKSNISSKKEQQVEEEEEEVEEDLPWIQEKALDLVEFTGSVTQAIPGPRVGRSNLPWVLAVPLAYVGITFVIAFVKTVRKFSSPREKRRKLVGVFTLFNYSTIESCHFLTPITNALAPSVYKGTSIVLLALLKCCMTVSP